MHLNKTISLILPTYRGLDTLKNCINSFENLEIIDEIIVVNNNAEEGTSEIIELTSAREVFQSIQGYGAAIKFGLAQVKGDLIVVCEPDGTFQAKDLNKLIAFIEDCDFVIGSRTVDNFIYSGANMGKFLRWGNWSVAKYLELLFNTAYLSDVGCTFRLFSRSFLESFGLESGSDDGRYGLDMLLYAVTTKGIRYVQIPVTYHERRGKSTYSGSFLTSFMLGSRMIFEITNLRFRRFFIFQQVKHR